MNGSKGVIYLILAGCVWWICPVTAVRAKIPLTKCCSDGELFMKDLDLCRTFKNATKASLKNAPPIHLIEKNADEMKANIHIGNDNFTITRKLQHCTDGTAGYSSNHYTFYEDGTLELDNTYYPPGNFCIHEEYPTRVFVARICDRDPCSMGGECIRKCCPLDKVFRVSSATCSNYSVPLIIKFHNGSYVDPSHFIIRDGGVPHCTGSSRLEYLNDDLFHMETNGSLRTLPSRWCEMKKQIYYTTKDYCIDNFITPDKILRQQALVCQEPNDKFYSYFLFVSSFFLVATFAVYALIPEIRNIHGIVIMCYVVSRAFAYILYGIMQLLGATSAGVCRAMSIMIHFSYLSAYTWLTAVCFDIWWTLRSMQPSNKSIIKNKIGKPFVGYSLFSWGIPAIIVVVGQIFDEIKSERFVRPGFGEEACWFSSYDAMFTYVYGPVFVFVFIDVILFALTYKILRQAGIASRGRNAREKYRLQVIFALFLLKILSWIAEFTAYAMDCLHEAAYAIDVVESLSSILTFVIFVCKSNVWRLLSEKFPCMKRLERFLPHRMASRLSNHPTVSTSVSSREALHLSHIKRPEDTAIDNPSFQKINSVQSSFQTPTV